MANSDKNQTPKVKGQMPHDGKKINLAMEIPNKPVKPTQPTTPPEDKK